MDIFRGIIGLAILIGLCWCLSPNRRQISWRLVGAGLGLQFLLAIGLLLFAPVSKVVEWVSGFFVKMLAFSDAGSRLLFGELLDASRYGIAFKILPTIIFVSAVTSLLYYLGILQRVVWLFAWVMKRVMGLSGAESLATAANVFIGQTEAPLLVRPYIGKMSSSELMALMTGGMATIAGSVFALYVAMLGGGDADAQASIAKHLLTASMMNAPAAIVVAKMLVPQAGKFDDKIEINQQKTERNILDAIARGTTEGLKLAVNVAAMLLVFIALIALINAGLGWLGALGGGGGVLNQWVANVSGGVFQAFSLEAIFGFVFAPIAWVIGGDHGDLLQLGQLLGTKMVSNEMIAYTQLADLNQLGSLSPKASFLATFALCGFANFSSIGIQIGGIGALAPERRGELASLGLKAMIGGTIASLMTATIAGMFFGG
ncbi:MAG: nucleoside transporter C-terminal domain-containing protein [Verrucomicrobiota bacterium]